jgi:hypothetical protein
MVAFMGSHGISHISQCYLNLNGAFCSALDINRCRADYCSFDVGSCFGCHSVHMMNCVIELVV